MSAVNDRVSRALVCVHEASGAAPPAPPRRRPRVAAFASAMSVFSVQNPTSELDDEPVSLMQNGRIVRRNLRSDDLSILKAQSDELLFAGEMSKLWEVTLKLTHDSFYRSNPDLSSERIEAALKARSILLVCEAIEGWAISISRWFLQAAMGKGSDTDPALGYTHKGPAINLLASCGDAVRPTVKDLIGTARRHGVARRLDALNAYAQCIEYHGLWARLVREGASLREPNRFGWTALHYAASTGSVVLTQSLLDLGADQAAKNNYGQTALHLAAAHGSSGAAALLVSRLPRGSRGSRGAWSSRFLDKLERDPEDVALLTAAADAAKCAAMLKALQPADAFESSKVRKRRCEEWAASRRDEAPGLAGFDRSRNEVPWDVADASWQPNCTAASEVAAAAASSSADAADADAIFSTIDADGSGAISREELRSHLRAAPPAPPTAGRRCIGSTCIDTLPTPAAAASRPGASEPAHSRRRRCDLQAVHVDNMTSRILMDRYLSVGQPVLVIGGAQPRNWREGWSRSSLSKRRGGIVLPMEDFPYSDASAALLSVASNRSRIGQLLADGSALFGPDACPGAAADAAPPPNSVFKAVKGWKRQGEYIYRYKTYATDPSFYEEYNVTELYEGCSGTTQCSADWGLDARRRADIVLSFAPTAAAKSVPMVLNLPDGRLVNRETSEGSLPQRSVERELSASDTQGIMEEWWNPPFIGDETDPEGTLRSASVQFYIGGRGAGAQPHWHAPAWNWLVRGRKEWRLWPPVDATYAQSHVQRSADGAKALGGAPLVCEQRAGDTLVVPALWGHATVNLAPSVGWATELRHDRIFDLGMQEQLGGEWWRMQNEPPDGEQAQQLKPKAAKAKARRGAKAKATKGRTRTRRTADKGEL